MFDKFKKLFKSEKNKKNNTVFYENDETPDAGESITHYRKRLEEEEKERREDLLLEAWEKQNFNDFPHPMSAYKEAEALYESRYGISSFMDNDFNDNCSADSINIEDKIKELRMIKRERETEQDTKDSTSFEEISPDIISNFAASKRQND